MSCGSNLGAARIAKRPRGAGSLLLCKRLPGMTTGSKGSKSNEWFVKKGASCILEYEACIRRLRPSQSLNMSNRPHRLKPASDI